MKREGDFLGVTHRLFAARRILKGFARGLESGQKKHDEVHSPRNRPAGQSYHKRRGSIPDTRPSLPLRRIREAVFRHGDGHESLQRRSLLEDREQQQ